MLVHCLDQILKHRRLSPGPGIPLGSKRSDVPDGQRCLDSETGRIRMKNAQTQQHTRVTICIQTADTTKHNLSHCSYKLTLSQPSFVLI